MGLNFVNLSITVRSNDVTQLRYCLPLLSKEYAAACRSLSCRWPERACETCSQRETCCWHLVFAQKLTSDSAALKRHQKPALPFIFSFSLLDTFSDNQKDMVCGLVVIGQALPHLEMLLNGFAELLLSVCAPVSAEIVQVASRDFQGCLLKADGDTGCVPAGKRIPENLVIISSDVLVESQGWIGSEMQLRLLSPLRLIEDGHLLTSFEFSRFMRSAMRRVSSLVFYYGENEEFDCDFKELSRLADDVICIENRFTYTNVTNNKRAGLIGDGCFRGDFRRLAPFLIIGSYLHTGKGSSFGMGAYEVAFGGGDSH